MNWKLKALLFTFCLGIILEVVFPPTNQIFGVYAVVGCLVVLLFGVVEIFWSLWFDNFRRYLRDRGRQRLYFFCCAMIMLGSILLIVTGEITKFIILTIGDMSNYWWMAIGLSIQLMLIPCVIINRVQRKTIKPTAKPIPWQKEKCQDCGLPVEVCMCDPELEERV